MSNVDGIYSDDIVESLLAYDLLSDPHPNELIDRAAQEILGLRKEVETLRAQRDESLVALGEVHAQIRERQKWVEVLLDDE